MVISLSCFVFLLKQTYKPSTLYFMAMIEACILMSERQFEMSKQTQIGLRNFSENTVSESF